MLTAVLGVLLVLNLGSDSTPPAVVVAATAAALVWVWRMHLHRAEAEQRADEALIASLRCAHDDERRREEEAFREITRYFNEGDHLHGMD
ncbi:hypothetical protein [Amycolatopsis dendrobii]|uniref:Uncharacterized protein n=1 Tax=Amycolatopsis dendrobii TaxID=2760662 RepID=A0A7W3VVF4_9PSEU|nr:hypothetical protein [Amycolatopsis dendrobii]MBB1153953.1 hypothetical protein [Amycolatopsis dendrobii]